jgi:hypothetical protein
MDEQDLADVETRRKVRDLWDKVVELTLVAERRRHILELTIAVLDYVPAAGEAELEQAERERDCAWVRYLDFSRKAYIPA